MCVYYSHNVEETYRIGERLGSKLRSGDVVAYFGGMGMGKTTFTHGLATGLGINEKDVSSPTFAIVNVYGKNSELCHFDMYRVNTWDDLYSTGFFDYIDNGIIIIEWSENIEEALPADCIKIRISKGENDDDRIFEIEGVDPQ